MEARKNVRARVRVCEYTSISNWLQHVAGAINKLFTPLIENRRTERTASTSTYGASSRIFVNNEVVASRESRRCGLQVASHKITPRAENSLIINSR
jgi:hypothetical protein